jgi:hypothetical protein
VAEAGGVSYFVCINATLSALEILQKLFQNQKLYWRLGVVPFTCEFACFAVRSLTSYGIKIKIHWSHPRAVPMSFNLRRPDYSRRRSFVSSLVEHTKIAFAYYQYEVTFPLYVMPPGEKFAFNSFMLIFLSLLIFTAETYLSPLVLIASPQLLWLGRSAANQLLLLT